MGKAFSKLFVSEQAYNQRLVGSDTTTTSSLHGIVSDRSSQAQRSSVSCQPIRIHGVYSGPSAEVSRAQLSPGSTNGRHTDQEETIVNENGRSPISPKSHMRLSHLRHAPSFSSDLKFSEVHRETGKNVFRRGSFGGKQAVQILCEQLHEILREATTNSPIAPHNETPFASSSWIMEPYEMIVHNKEQILGHRSSKQNGDAQKHLKMFLEFLELHQPGAWDKCDEVRSRKCQQILFKHLWLLYPPRAKVFTTDNGIWRAYMVEKSETIIDGKTTVLRIHTWFLDFDNTGKRLVPYKQVFDVSEYSSEQSIKLLELIPDWFMPNKDVHKTLVDRGRNHWRYSSTSYYKEYTGNAWTQGLRNVRENFTHATFFHLSADQSKSSLKVIVDYSTSTRCTIPDDGSRRHGGVSCCSVCIGESLGLFSVPLSASGGAHVCINSALPSPASTDRRFQGEEDSFLFCPPTIWAFSLRFKTWALVAHDQLSDVHKDDSFDKELYMEDARRTPLYEIVSAYMNDCSSTGHKHSGERRSLGRNILLEGSSGTGKTFTAGIQPDMLDQRLLETFTRAMNWNAMVLLDDVDIYGYDRSGHMYKRAALLPTFLRHLEYSACLTFISMASVKQADPALISRIHAAVPFPRFTFTLQKEIWKKFIESLDQDLVDKRHWDRFIDQELSTLDDGKHMDMNAWQIRSCIDVALSLARKDSPARPMLRPANIETVLSLGEAFRAHVLQEKKASTQANRDRIHNNPVNPFFSRA